jgi:hypothetical protein
MDLSQGRPSGPFLSLSWVRPKSNVTQKGRGWISLTNNPSALRHWIVAGPETARMVKEFKKQAFCGEATDVDHHERLSSFQITLPTQVNELVLEGSYCLFALDTKYMSADVVSTVKGIIDLKQHQYNFINEQFLKEEKSISEPIKRNKLARLSNKKKTILYKDNQSGILKSDLALFCRLYMATCIWHVRQEPATFKSSLGMRISHGPHHWHTWRTSDQAARPTLSSVSQHMQIAFRCILLFNSESLRNENLAIFYDPRSSRDIGLYNLRDCYGPFRHYSICFR